MARTRLAEVGDEFVPSEPSGEIPQAASLHERVESVATSVLVMSLKTLSQKSLVALHGLADLGMIGSAFVLWYRAMPAPTGLQLAGLAGYAAFILVALLARRRR